MTITMTGSAEPVYRTSPERHTGQVNLYVWTSRWAPSELRVSARVNLTNGSHYRTDQALPEAEVGALMQMLAQVYPEQALAHLPALVSTATTVLRDRPV